MEKFSGFPGRMQFTPIPNVFLSTLLPQIDDLAELKTTLHFFGILYRKRGYPRFVTYEELRGNKSLISSLSEVATPPEPILRSALETATRRGTVLHLALERDSAQEDVYFLNTDSDREAITRIRSGELKLPGRKTRETAPVDIEAPPDIFTAYEQNIGMLTPMIAEELREAEKIYPEGWIKEAIKEAVDLNKRNWRYITAILERWTAEGKGSGTYKRDTRADPDKYIKGKYGHMVRR
ncbi:DnaD domain-containing protein [Chloroflexota bacterium]